METDRGRKLRRRWQEEESLGRPRRFEARGARHDVPVALREQDDVPFVEAKRRLVHDAAPARPLRDRVELDQVLGPRHDGRDQLARRRGFRHPRRTAVDVIEDRAPQAHGAQHVGQRVTAHWLWPPDDRSSLSDARPYDLTAPRRPIDARRPIGDAIPGEVLMADSVVKTIDGDTRTLSSGALEAFRSGLRGQLRLPGEAGYDEARTIWNAMIDRRPAVVVRAAGAGDALHTVRLAAEHGLLLSVRGGGHNIAGNAVCEGGLMLDLSGMAAVRVDAGARRARVEPGARLADFDREAQAFGLATPLGINSTTGIGGLTLGGGFGWLSRKHGLTVDNLISAEIVTAKGELTRASAEENPDLFWAIRGGGGNFGVVTSFDFALHPVGPQVIAGLIVHPFSAAPAVLREYRELVAKAPDELCCWVVARKAPPLPFLPPEVHGTEVLVLALCHAGDLAAGAEAAAPFKAIGTPIADVVGPMPYAGWQAAFDPLLTP